MANNVNVMGAEANFTWGQLEPEEGVYNWDLIDQYVDLYKQAGRSLTLRTSAAYFQPDDSPRWLFNQYGVRRIAVESIFTGFEGGTGAYSLGSGAVTSNLVKNAPTDINGNYAWGTGELVSSGSHVFSGVNGQIVGFDYKALSDGKLTVKVIDAYGKVSIVGSFELQAGESGSKNIDVPATVIGGEHEIVWEYEGNAVSLDNLSISEDRPGWYSAGNLTYPDYFNDMYKEKFENFVKALTDRYQDNKTIDTVTVGGYGVYSELGLTGSLEQWTAYGYTDEKYIEHVKWCAELYKKYFKDSKTLILHTYTGDVPSGNADYISYKAASFAADNGFTMKTNSLQAKLTEYRGLGGTGWAYMVNRYKHDSDVKVIHETAGQSGNPSTLYMGHPLSVLNRAIIDGVDRYWLYWSDSYQDYPAKYLHYANEQAGAGLFTNLYIRFGYYDFVDENGTATHTHTNIMNGLWLYENDWTVMEYVDGVQAISTMDNLEPVEISVDDRQKYNSMYGSVITVHYYDSGTSAFDVAVREGNGDSNVGTNKVIGTVQLKDSGVWKTASFYSTAWGRTQRNSGEDMRREIILTNTRDDMVYFSGVEVDYVPAREWAEQVLKASGHTKNEKELNGAKVRVSLDNGQRASSLTVPVRAANETGESNMIADVYAVTSAGERVKVTAKEHYMASEVRDELVLPVAEAPAGTVAFDVELETLAGEMTVFTTQDGKPAVQVNGYAAKEETESFGASNGVIEAADPFFGLTVDAKYDGKSFTLYRYIDGAFTEIESGVVHNGGAYTEPQTAGIYKLEIEGTGVKSGVLALKRLEATNEPTRYLVGSDVAAGFTAANGAMWTPAYNLKNIEHTENGGMTAKLAGSNPRIQSANISVTANAEQTFRMVLKNETGSNFVKVYWKTAEDNAYSEDKSLMMPVVANDDQYREYSWPIGAEKGYKGVVTGLTVQPATGESKTGRVSILVMDLRLDSKVVTKGLEKLTASAVADDSVGTLFDVTKKNTDTDTDIDYGNDGGSGNGGNVNTGDTSLPAGAAVVAVISGFAAAVLYVRKRTQRRRRL
jgi:hypothetical protein